MARGKRVKKSSNVGLTIGISLVALAALIIAVVGVYEVYFKNIAAEPENDANHSTVIDQVTPVENEEKKYAVPASLKLSDGTEISLGVSGELTEKEIREAVKKAAESVNIEAVDDSWIVNENTITLVKGTDGAKLNEESAFDVLTGAVEADEALIETVEAAKLDLDDVWAVFSTEATEDSEGMSFDLEAAKEAFNALQPGESVEIEILAVKNGYTDADFPDVLCEKSTSLKTSSANRITNVTLAAEAINGLVLEPGDKFSYNGVVGQRTAAKGYKPAGAYVGGETVDEIGGGICQVSSTLYWCALKSDLKIVKRSNHMYPVAYLPLGFDATVNWGTIDFQFENSLSHPIRLSLYVENKELFVKIEGTKESENTIELKYVTIETVDWTTEYRIDESLEAGTTKEKQKGQVGYVVDTYRIVKDADGKKLEETKIARNKYRPHTNIILCAPDAYEKIMAELNGTPLPEETPTETPAETPVEETPAEEQPEEKTEEETPKIPASGANLIPNEAPPEDPEDAPDATAENTETPAQNGTQEVNA